MSVYVCPGIRLMADGRRRAQSVSNMASCVCPGMCRPQDTARSCCFPTILFSFACRGIQDAHADRNNVPVSHTSRHAYRDQSYCLSSSPALRHAVKPLEPRGFRLDNKKPRGWNPRGTADEARFELAEGFALTRFRGVLLRPLGHSSKSLVTAMTAENMQPDYYRTISRASVPRVAMMREYPPPSCSHMPTQACTTNVQPNSYSKVRFALIASARAASSSSGG